jgi:hypothetical protein
MPAQAGIQGYSVLASGYTAWTPGCALLARNDESVGCVVIVQAGIQPEPVRRLAKQYVTWQEPSMLHSSIQSHKTR